MDTDMKKYFFIEALIKFTEIYAETTYGDAEINISEIVSYVESPKFIMRDAWTVQSLDDCYQLIEEMVLRGLPIWRFLRISEWSQRMLEKDLEVLANEQEEALKKQYKCFQGCRYYDETLTSLGLLMKCTYKPPTIGNGRLRTATFLKREGSFSPKETCDEYQEKESS